MQNTGLKSVTVLYIHICYTHIFYILNIKYFTEEYSINYLLTERVSEWDRYFDSINILTGYLETETKNYKK